MRRAYARKSSSAPPPGYVADPTAPPMLRYQASLPRLPVPTLESTCAKYLETVEPLLTPSAFAKTQASVTSFLQSPLAAELQTRLKNRAAAPETLNWLSEWWNDAAYMGYRDPVVVFVSYFFVHVDDRLRRDPAKRAASLIKAMLPFRELVESCARAPLCMASYKWLFHASRYPVKPSDTASKFDPKTHNHIVVLRKNRFFVVPLADAQGNELSAADLEAQFNSIIAQAGEGSASAPPEELVRAGNEETLKKIESAMIIVALDDTKPVTREDISWNTWVGNGRNRWYDKHQLIVYDNGRSGFLGEHSCMDGTPTLRMNEFMLASLAAHKTPLGSPTPAAALPAPTELTFTLPRAEKRFDDLVGAHDLHLVKQLAWHKMHGRPAVTYESAQTRKYQLGRTEVIRSASRESRAARATHRVEALFTRAAKRHGQYAAWAADGQGGEKVPEVYTDEAFAKSSHWELSTSQLSSRFFDGWGYGEVVPDGYGLSYSIGDDYVRWTITSLKRDTALLKHYLAEAATEVKHMLTCSASFL
ncbi:hypothetical protein BJ912DRAFT_1021947 [Pholiota molesta]|nr:hypothetical protein BJ912DRAFT_1021947 [Pholiota molesta]